MLILNLSYSGLGIARDLRGRGVRVVGLSSDRKIYGNFTRMCEVRFAPDAQSHPEELVRYLLSAADELRGAVIFPTNDFDVLFLDSVRAQLEPYFRLSIPSHECLQTVMDKERLSRAAQDAGIPTPKTAAVASAAELEIRAPQIGFPHVLKPISSVHWHRRETVEILHGTKALPAGSLDELKKIYEKVSVVSPRVLLQEWVPGDARSISVVGGYADRSSELLAYFMARKIVQTPDDFGTGCLVEAVDIPVLLNPTKSLLKALNFHGVAEIEYKRDSRNGEYKLIEINPRHWDWHQLGSAAGVNLTWTAYCDLTGRSMERVAPQTTDAKWIAEDAFLHYMFQHALHGKIDARRIISALSGRRIYGIFAWSDPLPFVCYSLTVGLPRFGQKLFRELRGASKHVGALVVALGLCRSAMALH